MLEVCHSFIVAFIAKHFCRSLVLTCCTIGLADISKGPCDAPGTLSRRNPPVTYCRERRDGEEFAYCRDVSSWMNKTRTFYTSRTDLHWVGQLGTKEQIVEVLTRKYAYRMWQAVKCEHGR